MAAKRSLKSKPAPRKAKTKPVSRKGVRASAQTRSKTRATPGRAATKEAIRERIVKAALGLFQTKGFDATTTKAIAHKAKIAEGTVFNYFKSKDDIALHFFEMEVDSAMATVRDNPHLRKAPLEEKLFALVQ